MARRLGKTRALAAALVLAGAAIFGTAASAQFQYGDPECRQEAIAGCAANWQAYGYPNYEDCVLVEPCYACNAGYMCGFYDPGWAMKPDTGKPW